jgi:hypothetical protein
LVAVENSTNDPLLTLAFEELAIAEKTRSTLEIKVAIACCRLGGLKKIKPVTTAQEESYKRLLVSVESRIFEIEERIKRLKELSE